MKHLPEGAGSQISRMPQTKEGSYNQQTTPILLIRQAEI
jgi:hypothetical protein